MATVESSPRLKNSVLLVMAAIILGFSMLGFVAKFIEFIRTFQGDTDGVFAITPMLNYLLASVGFFCMLVWATANGMFHDLERPKHRMLEIEDELDRVDDDNVPDWFRQPARSHSQEVTHAGT